MLLGQDHPLREQRDNFRPTLGTGGLDRLGERQQPDPGLVEGHQRVRRPGGQSRQRGLDLAPLGAVLLVGQVAPRVLLGQVGQRPLQSAALALILIGGFALGFLDHGPGGLDGLLREPGLCDLGQHLFLHKRSRDQHSEFMPMTICDGITGHAVTETIDSKTAFYNPGLPGLPWDKYNMEQQACIVAGWFAGKMRYAGHQTYEPMDEASPWFRYIAENIWLGKR